MPFQGGLISARFFDLSHDGRRFLVIKEPVAVGTNAAVTARLRELTGRDCLGDHRRGDRLGHGHQRHLGARSAGALTGRAQPILDGATTNDAYPGSHAS